MNQFYKNLALWIVIILMMIMLYNIFNQQRQMEMSINYTDFLSMVEKEQIQKVVIQDQNIYATNVNGKQFKVYAPEDNQLIKMLREKNVAIEARPPAEAPWFLSALISWLPMILLIGIWIYFMRQMQSGGGKALSFGKSRARLLSDETKRLTFNDVAGIDEAKEEVTEVIEFLKDPHKFTRLGGRIPKGVLLVGSPGTGKTLLARAIAGEAGVPFFSISGSDFVEMFVGVGASRVRDLFVQGKKNAPCLIYIDEIDAVGRHRGAGLGGGHDEREQTLNQLLVEMDGFESNEGVILIAATNRPDVLDPALLRPGRFDRQVVVPMPDIRGRRAILDVYIQKIPADSDVNIGNLAKGTPGFTGADLENLVNEAALYAAKRNKEKVGMVDFEDAKDKVYMGLERKSKVIKEEDRKVTAYHEGGHAIVARLLPYTDAVNKITIIPRGRAGGVTWFLPEERDFKFKDQLENELAISFGGRVAEEVVFGRISTGAANDIKQATELAQRMVRDWGMSENLGLLSYSNNDEQIFLGREIAQHRDYSEATARRIDEEIERIIKNSHIKAKTLLTENVDILHKLADLLLEKETVLGPELDDLIRSLRPGIQLHVARDDEAEKPPETKPEAKPEKKPETEEPPKESTDATAQSTSATDGAEVDPDESKGAGDDEDSGRDG
ncbi:MAG: ATP-dependent zinc metalloprotease FtsH [Thermodesulfobacteriota bacterium]|nr:ATP-dependent zinc metalloprotease FtsH [Thermodesulfobacteriota bacterium]